MNVDANAATESESSSSTNLANNATTNEQSKSDKNNSEAMDIQHSMQGCKRQFSGDSDSDDKAQSRRTKINPVPNLNNARSRSKDKTPRDIRE